MSILETVIDRLREATFVQAARLAEQASAQDGNDAKVGTTAPPGEEPIRFFASDRLHLVANDLASAELKDGKVHITANLLGIAGATPALPPVYSELQLQRRRSQDRALGHFFNLFDHRALSFFYRIARKFNWALLAEGRGQGREDEVASLLASIGGLDLADASARLDFPAAALVPLAAHLGDARRSAASLETILRSLVGLPLRIVQACPVWMQVPPSEQTRLGAVLGQFVQLGSDDREGLGTGEAAMIGAAVLDAQHHFMVEIGPVSYEELRGFCSGSRKRRLVSQICALSAGLDQRPSIRLLIAANDIPPLRLGDEETPALLGWTSWLGAPKSEDGIIADCILPMDRQAIG